MAATFRPSERSAFARGCVCCIAATPRAADRRRLAVTLVTVPLKLRIDINTGNPGARTEDCPWS